MIYPTFIALKESIEHWHRLLSYGVPVPETPGAADCSLCVSHRKGHPAGACIQCPVCVFSGQAWCRGTPYKAASEAYWDWIHSVRYSNSNRIRDRLFETWQKAGKVMLDYLIDLLPDVEPMPMSIYG